MEMFIKITLIILLVIVTFLCGYSTGWDKAMLDVAKEELEKTQKDIKKIYGELQKG